ncbi:MAG: FAD-dependent oxidoreductase [Candidatus Gracilibacteria bacterium]|nr:FAD-dependent oxidoreductase [Candidatus Gracilibacteria bacterium]
MNRKKIDVLGAGINGITSAISLELAGYDTQIHSQNLPFDLDSRDSRISKIATDFAAASVIPHTVEIDNLATRMGVSQQIFRILSQHTPTGVGWRRHYEVFEKSKKNPPYANLVDNFSRFPESGEGISGAPRRNNVDEIWGWTFRALFADMPVYLQWLNALYINLGGKIVTHEITPETISDLKGSAIVNCTGYGSSVLFPELYSTENSDFNIVKGYLVHLPTGNIIVPKNNEELLVSYNYTPDPKDFEQGQDVYFYPRKSDIVLGGTRQKGNFESDGKWNGDRTKGPTIEITGVEIPEGVITINREIILNLTGIDIEQFDKSACCGYRFTTSKVRLEIGENLRRDRKIIHNVGHGGSGVTLSWGCATQVVELVCEALNDQSKNSEEICNSLQEVIRQK